MTGGWRKTKARRSKGAVNWKGRKEPREGKGGRPRDTLRGSRISVASAAPSVAPACAFHELQWPSGASSEVAQCQSVGRVLGGPQWGSSIWHWSTDATSSRGVSVSSSLQPCLASSPCLLACLSACTLPAMPCHAMTDARPPQLAQRPYRGTSAHASSLTRAKDMPMDISGTVRRGRLPLGAWDGTQKLSCCHSLI